MYSTRQRPRSTSTSKTVSSHSDGSGQHAPESATTVEGPLSPPKSHNTAKIPVAFGEHNIPSFDFDFGTLLPMTPISRHSLPVIKTLEDVVARFPAFEIEKADKHSRTNRDYKCADCEAIFSSQKDCDLHNQSRFCPGSAAIAFALYRDARQPGGYRIDKKYIPFDGQQSSIKCRKCHLSFNNRLLKNLHERNHPPAHMECLHCGKQFSTTTELESHYQWHDDMEHRHHRNKCRRKLPGLKLQSEPLHQSQFRADVADLGRKSVFLADEDLKVVAEDSMGETREQGRSVSNWHRDVIDLDLGSNFEPEKELVAISFISPEDLERVHAPNGVFREVEPGYLDPQKETRTHHVANALDALEGRSVKSQASSVRTTSSTQKADRSGHSPKFDDQPEATSPQPVGIKKRSSIRRFFRRTKSEPQLESSKPDLFHRRGVEANRLRP